MIYFKHLILFIVFLGHFGVEMAAANESKDQPLVGVLQKIEEEYKVVFSYNSKDVKDISVSFEWKTGEKFEATINRVLRYTGLKYKSVGLNFYIIYKDSQLNTQKLRKIERKIEKIKKIGNRDDFIISDHQSIIKVSEDNHLKTIQGKITNQNGEPLIGASVLVVGTTKGTTSDENGNFKLATDSTANEIAISYTGCFTQKINISDKEILKVQLEEGLSLQSVTVFGSRGAPRTRFDSPIPIDHLSMEELNATGENTLDQQLASIVPSFNSGQHPVSDASAHMNPIDLKGLLPSRTLVLVNGKRKNASALLYTYVTGSRGEVGVDMKSVDATAVRAVEVLRDGAAAQYGSDAIAGVINLELKEKIKPFLKAGYSTTNEFDGTQFNVAGGYSFELLKKGFATFTAGYHQQNRSQRAGTITSAEDETAYWGTSIFTAEDFSNYLERNPRAGFQVGLPDVKSINATVNLSYTINEETDTKLYAFGTLMNRGGSSPQFARGPYWVTGFEEIYPGQDYFLPEMAPKISDQMMSVGLKHSWKQWNMDLSSTFGNSRMEYYINNSFNQSLGKESPKNFYNGAHRFRHLVNNLDISKTFYPVAIETFTVAFGMEQRVESFNGYAGEFASYGDGTPDIIDRIGSESFSGLSPKDEVQGSRNNIGFYSELTSDITPNIQLGGAGRFENYSDFGANLSWKLNALFKVIPSKLNFRTAISNGFRAPSLHQIYYTSTTTTLTQEGVVQNRIINNLDPALSILGIPKLTPETSLNIGAGFNFNISKNICIAFDTYQINLKNRVVLSGQIGMQDDPNSPINQLLENTETSSAGFFLNAVNTSTQGIDLVLSIQKIKLPKGRWKGSLAANFNKTSVTDIHLPSFIEGNQLRDEVFSREDVSRLESWRPKHKIIFSNTYTLNNFSTTVGITHFGSVTYKHPEHPADDATYGGKIITNLSFEYNFSSKLKWHLGINNLFNVYPDTFSDVYQGTPNDRNIDFVGRFQYPWQTMQIGIDGIRGFTKLTFTL